MIKTAILFRVIGTTDEVTTCEYCGRVELKGTVVLEVLDVDGNREDTVYYGTGCAATAGRRTVKSVREEIKAVDAAKREADRIKREDAHRASIAERDVWIATNFGSDALENPRKYGFTGPVGVCRAYFEATGK